MAQALYRKWRPARFHQVIGQEHVTRTLRNAVASGRSGHAYLFCGPRGTGKTTVARLLAKAVNCLHDDLGERPCNECANCLAIAEGRFLDLIEIDAASNTGVDDIRDLREKINFSPSEGRFKVYIIDEVHMLSTAAFNALLKTLEEPPPHAKFVLATTEEHKVPMTIKSRCQQFNFRLLTLAEIEKRLGWIAEQEQLSIEPAALQLIAQQGAGSIRDAESLLDQLVTVPGDTISLERTQAILGTASSQAVADLVDAWLVADAPGGLRVIHEALSSGADVRQFARQMVDYLRQVLLVHTAGEEVPLNAAEEERDRMLSQARQSSRQDLIDAVKAFNEAALAASSSWQPQLPLELAFIGLLPPGAAQGSGAPDTVTAGRRQPPAEVEPEKEKVVRERPQAIAQDETAPERAAAAEKEKPAGEGEEQTQKPAETPHKAPAAPSSGESPSITLEMVKQNWAEMIRRVGQEDTNLPALLAMCKPLATERHVIILGFDYPVLKDKFEDGGTSRELVASTMSDLLESKCLVRSVVTGQYTPPPEPEATGSPRAEAPQVDGSPPDAPHEDEPPVDEAEFHALAEELGGRVRKG